MIRSQLDQTPIPNNVQHDQQLLVLKFDDSANLAANLLGARRRISTTRDCETVNKPPFQLGVSALNRLFTAQELSCIHSE